MKGRGRREDEVGEGGRGEGRMKGEREEDEGEKEEDEGEKEEDEGEREGGRMKGEREGEEKGG